MKLRCVLPLAAFLILVIALAAELSRDPRELPPPLVGRPAPTFRLTALESTAGLLTPQDLRGKAWMLNVWAPWCTVCRVEYAVLDAFAKQSAVPIYGLNYKDDTDAARAWLKQMGDPYVTSLIDAGGKVGIDYGVYGTPETFVTDRAGVVCYRQAGPVTAESMERRIVPLLQRLKQEGGHA